ncbi:hypothetical protein V2S66_16300 [Streptomyces sp. V4-01]|uniref:Secreted protein n=1 Tax=Actinacidiphila polyblastidii TaxID=3110430 RepID=A0ABU7PE05_9ACTN|nr:hypothetical protein [Streptomyces sp. V4-01]
MKRVLRTVAPLVLAAGTVIAIPTVSHAASAPCAGYTIDNDAAQRYYDSKGVAVATSYIYTKGSPYLDSSPSCAVFYAEGTYSTETKYMGITLCDNYTATACDTDHGNYKEYAGPVTQAHGGCGTVHVVMRNPAGTTIVDSSYGMPCD